MTKSVNYQLYNTAGIKDYEPHYHMPVFNGAIDQDVKTGEKSWVVDAPNPLMLLLDSQATQMSSIRTMTEDPTQKNQVSAMVSAPQKPEYNRETEPNWAS
jgi:hypothetical protein